MSISVYPLSSLSSFTGRDIIIMPLGLQTPRITVLRIQSVILDCLNFIRQQNKMHWTDFSFICFSPEAQADRKQHSRWYVPIHIPNCQMISDYLFDHVMCKAKVWVTWACAEFCWRQRCGGVVLLSTRDICLCVCVCEHAVFACVCRCVRSHTINRWVKSSCLYKCHTCDPESRQWFNVIWVGFHLEKLLNIPYVGAEWFVLVKN